MDDVFELYWKHFRTQLVSWWDRLDEQDVRWVNGSRENLIALLQARYNYSRVECENIVRQRIDEFEQRHRNKLGSFIQERRRFILHLPGQNYAASPLREIEHSTNKNEPIYENANATKH